MRPTCPDCGSVKVSIVGKRACCLEDDCRCEGSESTFRRPHGPGRQTCNTCWRDPIPLTMDGYNGE